MHIHNRPPTAPGAPFTCFCARIRPLRASVARQPGCDHYAPGVAIRSTGQLRASTQPYSAPGRHISAQPRSASGALSAPRVVAGVARTLHLRSQSSLRPESVCGRRRPARPRCTSHLSRFAPSGATGGAAPGPPPLAAVEARGESASALPSGFAENARQGASTENRTRGPVNRYAGQDGAFAAQDGDDPAHSNPFFNSARGRGERPKGFSKNANRRGEQVKGKGAFII